ncbi:MAG: hypothetical protein ABI183_19925 [Polyangiaceae bacterium]
MRKPLLALLFLGACSSSSSSGPSDATDAGSSNDGSPSNSGDSGVARDSGEQTSDSGSAGCVATYSGKAAGSAISGSIPCTVAVIAPSATSDRFQLAANTADISAVIQCTEPHPIGTGTFGQTSGGTGCSPSADVYEDGGAIGYTHTTSISVTLTTVTAPATAGGSYTLHGTADTVVSTASDADTVTLHATF